MGIECVHRPLAAWCSKALSAPLAILIGWCLVSGCAIAQPLKASEVPDLPRESPQSFDRPLLHLEVSKSLLGERKLLFSAVHADGRRAGSLEGGLGVTWSPRGTDFSFISRQPSGDTLYTQSLEGGPRTIVRVERPRQIVSWHPAWSPEGKHIAFLSVLPGKTVGDNAFFLAIVDVATRARVAEHRVPYETLANFPFFTTPPNKFRWSPDGRRILVSWGNVIVVDAENGKVQTVSKSPAAAEWAPTGDAIYYLALRDTHPASRAWEGLFLRKLDAAEPTILGDAARLSTLGLTMPRGMNYGLLSLSPNGSMLAIAAGPVTNALGSVRVYETHRGADLNLSQPRTD